MIKRMAKEMLKRYYEIKQWNKLENRERNICLSHPDWEPLTRSEISKINKKEKHAYMIYKNMQFFSPNFVSDAYYQTTLLPMLNNYDYLFFGNFVPTDFSDKNYFEIFMPSLRFPDAVIRKINGYFYDDGYNRISMEKAISLVMENDTLVLKKSVDSGHGEGVKKIDAAQLRDRIMGGV